MTNMCAMNLFLNKGKFNVIFLEFEDRDYFTDCVFLQCHCGNDWLKAPTLQGEGLLIMFTLLLKTSCQNATENSSTRVFLIKPY